MPWSDKHKLNRGQCSVPDTSLAAVLRQTQCQQSHVPYGNHIDSPVRVHVSDGCWGDSEGLWLGSYVTVCKQMMILIIYFLHIYTLIHKKE